MLLASACISGREAQFQEQVRSRFRHVADFGVGLYFFAFLVDHGHGWPSVVRASGVARSLAVSD